MFPSTDSINISTTSNTTSSSNSASGTAFKFDFSTGQHVVTDGDLKECNVVENITQIVEVLIRTQLDKYKVYTDAELDFGLSIYNYVGKRQFSKGFIFSELKRELVKQLTSYDEIDELNDFAANLERRTLYVSFSLTLSDETIIQYKTEVGL